MQDISLGKQQVLCYSLHSNVCSLTALVMRHSGFARWGTLLFVWSLVTCLTPILFRLRQRNEAMGQSAVMLLLHIQEGKYVVHVYTWHSKFHWYKIYLHPRVSKKQRTKKINLCNAGINFLLKHFRTTWCHSWGPNYNKCGPIAFDIWLCQNQAKSDLFGRFNPS